MSKYNLTVDASQFKIGDKTFAGQSIKGGDAFKKEATGNEFVNIIYQGAPLKITTGDWLVEFPDGRKEVYNDAEFGKLFSPVAPAENPAPTSEEQPPVVEEPKTETKTVPESPAPTSEEQ